MRSVIRRWNFGLSPVEPVAAIGHINDRLTELERTLDDWALRLDVGPIPGAYVPLVFHLDNDGAALSGGDVTVSIRTNFELTPIYFTANTDTDSATVQLRDGATELLVADLDTAAGSPWVNTLSGFTVAHTAKQAELFVRVETPTGSPTRLHAFLLCSHVQKAHSPQGA